MSSPLDGVKFRWYEVVFGWNHVYRLLKLVNETTAQCGRFERIAEEAIANTRAAQSLCRQAIAQRDFAMSRIRELEEKCARP